MNPQAGHRTTCWKSHTRAPIRLLSIRAPRQARLRTSSRLAPFVHQQTLRPPGAKDARCVRPTSATQSNCVHPHLVCSRLALATFAAGRPVETKAPRGNYRGTGRFTTPEDRFGGSSFNARDHVLYCLAAWRYVRGRFLPTALKPIEPLTPLSQPSISPVGSPSRDSSERPKTAETTFCHRLVKADAT
jgi:hypothetical protein